MLLRGTVVVDDDVLDIPRFEVGQQDHILGGAWFDAAEREVVHLGDVHRRHLDRIDRVDAQFHGLSDNDVDCAAVQQVDRVSFVDT